MKGILRRATVFGFLLGGSLFFGHRLHIDHAEYPVTFHFGEYQYTSDFIRSFQIGDKSKQDHPHLVLKMKELGYLIHTEVRKHLPKRYLGDSFDLTRAILGESMRAKIDPVLILALIQTESSFSPVAKGKAGELGLMQVKPSTARWVAKKEKLQFNDDNELYAPITNVVLGIRYLSYLSHRFDSEPKFYVSAYNMGYRNVLRLLQEQQTPRIYFERVRQRYSFFYDRLSQNFQIRRQQSQFQITSNQVL